LATPLTVCVVVLCKYIPELEFVAVLMGDEHEVEGSLVYYQRLLARDTDEATDIVKGFLKGHPAEQVYDQLFIPALHWTKRDALRAKLDVEDQRFIVQTTREVMETLDELQPLPIVQTAAETQSAPASGQLRILGCPARDAVDELGLQMLGRLLDTKRFDLTVLSSEMLFSEMIAAVRERKPDVIVVGALAPGPVAPARHFCKRLRDSFPSVQILVCRLGQADPARTDQDPLMSAGADFAGTTLLETRNHLLGLFPVLTQPEDTPRGRAQTVAAPATAHAA
jgi:hypothetical protein